MILKKITHAGKLTVFPDVFLSKEHVEVHVFLNCCLVQLKIRGWDDFITIHEDQLSDVGILGLQFRTLKKK